VPKTTIFVHFGRTFISFYVTKIMVTKEGRSHNTAPPYATGFIGNIHSSK